MPRYATIDKNSGLVWWVGFADDPAQAVALSDAVDPSSAGEHRYHECLSGRIASDAAGGFYVYEVPANFDATAEQYAEVEKYPLVAAYKATRHVNEDWGL